jgi:hypothetical protein
VPSGGPPMTTSTAILPVSGQQDMVSYSLSSCLRRRHGAVTEHRGLSDRRRCAGLVRGSLDGLCR